MLYCTSSCVLYSSRARSVICCETRENCTARYRKVFAITNTITITKRTYDILPFKQAIDHDGPVTIINNDNIIILNFNICSRKVRELSCLIQEVTVRVLVRVSVTVLLDFRVL